MKKSNDYISGFKHGVKWVIILAKTNLCKYDGMIAQGELGALEIDFDNLLVDSKEAVKSLKAGR